MSSWTTVLTHVLVGEPDFTPGSTWVKPGGMLRRDVGYLVVTVGHRPTGVLAGLWDEFGASKGHRISGRSGD